MSLGSKEKADARHLFGKDLPQPFLQVFNPNRRAGFQLHLQHAFLRAAVPEVNEIDRVRRTMHAQETQRDRRRFAARLLLDEVQRLQRDGFGAVNLRARRRAQPQLNLSGIHLGKDLRAQPPSHEHDHHRRQHQVKRRHRPARPRPASVPGRHTAVESARKRPSAAAWPVAAASCRRRTQTDRMGTSVLDKK